MDKAPNMQRFAFATFYDPVEYVYIYTQTHIHRIPISFSLNLRYTSFIVHRR